MCESSKRSLCVKLRLWMLNVRCRIIINFNMEETKERTFAHCEPCQSNYIAGDRFSLRRHRMASKKNGIVTCPIQVRKRGRAFNETKGKPAFD